MENSKLKGLLKNDHGKVAGRNTHLGVVEIHKHTCESGQITAWTEFYNFEADVLDETSASVQAYKAWKEGEWEKFCLIGNAEGIPSAMQQTCIV